MTNPAREQSLDEELRELRALKRRIEDLADAAEERARWFSLDRGQYRRIAEAMRSLLEPDLSPPTRLR